MTAGISSRNTTSGSSFSPSTSDTMDRWGMMPYPAAMDRSAARIEEAYAQKRATPSILDAFLPSLVIDGAIKPMIISGTQKLIISDKINFTVTTIFITAAPAAFTDSRPASCPAMIPITTPRSSLNGRLENSFFMLSSLSLLFFFPHTGKLLSLPLHFCGFKTRLV